MNETTIRFLMLGGFLGAGKTTAIARLARHYINQGLRVGLVTNDQAFDLVDTLSLRAQGFDVGEVPGACFCCKFDDLITTVQGLCRDERPDIIIAEPVGSCTDLVATVLEPMRGLYGDDFQTGRFAVLLKPEHGLKILRRSETGFSEQAAYIFMKQLEEADLVVINKIDKLDDAIQLELRALVAAAFPGKPCLAVSATRGAGFEQLIEALNEPIVRSSLMDVDYDVYAEGEAELGWLNSTIVFNFSDPAHLDRLAVQLVEAIQARLKNANTEAAHLKVLVSDEDSNAAIANLVGNAAGVDLSISSSASAMRVEATVNARVATDPDALEIMVRSAIEQVAGASGAATEFKTMRKLSPGRPVPTHRVTF